jgi:tetratricopeptide (TPR) repeat protein
MRTLSTIFRALGVLAVITLLTGVGPVQAQLKPGDPAPLFVLKDLQGQSFELATMRDRPMVILYFFDSDSKSSQEGLLNLDNLAKKYKDANLTVWGVTRSAKNKVSSFLASTHLSFPVLMDSGSVSDIYSARLILPTVCIVGPDLLLLDYFQGGGKTTEEMLVALAQRTLQNRQGDLAKAISSQVVKQDPKNAKAKSIQGYAELKQGDLKAAEKTFYDLSREKGSGEILGKEGLSKVYAQKGEPEKALNLTKEVEAKSGQRAGTHVVKADLLYSQHKPKDAEKEYRQAAEKSTGDPATRAVAYNQLGRIYALNGQYGQSQEMYEKAVGLDPYFVEATSNKGMIFERRGEWDKALEAYRRAQSIDRNDPFAAALAENARKMLLMDKDPDKRKQLEQKIATCIQHYKENSAAQAPVAQDPWTSGTMVLTLVEPEETGGLSMRDGFGRVLTIYLASQLNASGRIEVVEPVVLERVMAGLGLKPKDMADENTVFRLARAFGARLVGKATLFHLSDGTLLNLKIVESDHPEDAQTIQHQFASAVTLRKDLHWLTREILTSVMTKYPLQAYAVEVTGNQVLMNLGAAQGVVKGALFDVVDVKPPVVFKGKAFQPEPSVMATLEVVQVDPDFSYAQIKEQRRPVKPEDKLKERINQVGEEGLKLW